MEKEILLFVTSIMGSLGFSIIFNIKGIKILIASLGGGISYSIFLICMYSSDNLTLSIVLASVTAATLAEIFARICKTPVTILLVPMLIPLIPGGELYYAMNYIIFGDLLNFNMKIQLVVREMGAIAGGIITVSFLAQFVTKLKNYIKQSAF